MTGKITGELTGGSLKGLNGKAVSIKSITLADGTAGDSTKYIDNASLKTTGGAEGDPLKFELSITTKIPANSQLVFQVTGKTTDGKEQTVETKPYVVK